MAPAGWSNNSSPKADAGTRLEARKPRRYKVTTDSRHPFPVAPNILNRQFEAAEPNKVWTADITYVWILAGWLYLAVVMDLFSRQIVEWVMDKRMKKQLVMDGDLT